jgi:ribosomal-protein-alanine N-acetyltransferase
MVINFPELESIRLAIREIHPREASFIHFMRSDPEVNQFVTRKATTSVEDASKFIEDRLLDNRLKKAFYWSIYHKKDGKMMGSICLWRLDFNKMEAEVGYDLHPSFHRQGFMTEAVKKVIDFGFSHLDLKLIYGVTSDVNKPSQGVLRKAGFKESNVVLSEKDIENQLVGFVITAN